VSGLAVWKPKISPRTPQIDQTAALLNIRQKKTRQYEMCNGIDADKFVSLIQFTETALMS